MLYRALCRLRLDWRACSVQRLPARLVAPVSVLASSSLFVYLTHWQVYPHLEDRFPVAAVLASFAVGIACWWLCRPLLRGLGRRLHGAPGRRA